MQQKKLATVLGREGGVCNLELHRKREGKGRNSVVSGSFTKQAQYQWGTSETVSSLLKDESGSKLPINYS